MDYERAITEFLSQADNFPVALQIAEHIKAAKEKIQLDFWNACSGRISGNLEASPFKNRWRADLDEPQRLASKWYGVSIRPAGADQAPVHVIYYLCQEYYREGWFYFYPGLTTNTNEGLQDRQCKELDELRRILDAEGFDSTKAWIGWKAIRSYESPNPFLVELSGRSEELWETSVELLWDVFEKTVEQVEKVNAWLKKAQ